ncbi:hypothetical protein ACFL2R_01345 [Patescibacteria group bacterium]
MTIEIVSGLSKYQVIEKVADAEVYQLFLCKQEELSRQLLLQVASEKRFNSKISQVAFILQQLKEAANEAEADYAKTKTDPDDILNYDLGFPDLIDSFVCEEESGRHINIFGYKHTDDFYYWIPLIKIAKKNQRRIDLRTSAWIVGKFLKLLAFIHDNGFSVNLMTRKNLLVQPDQHWISIFDWMKAEISFSGVSDRQKRADISQMAKSVILTLGGSPAKGFIPYDEDVEFDEYCKPFSRLGDDSSDIISVYKKEAFEKYRGFLLRLARGAESDAGKAHTEFYELIDSLWVRKFYPITTKPLN